ncbi:hypothetical protein MUP59_09100 [Candidatus Bathyarchaeota archaeon]|nr:hypothetical protein [Candidatus Bathyarchaeota archaeon]
MFLSQIGVQLDWQIVSIVLPFVMVIVVIMFGEILFWRSHQNNMSKEVTVMSEPSQISDTKNDHSGSPESFLQRLRIELEQLSSMYSSGEITRKQFSERVRKIENELSVLRAPIPIAEPPKAVRCVHCQDEIPIDSLYCDRCGRYLGSLSK